MDDKLTGLDVLNTSGGGTVSEPYELAALLAAVFIITAFVAGVTWLGSRRSTWRSATTAAAALALVIATIVFGRYDVPIPVEYEVIVQPGHVIDAARWEIVDQRGQIYVITEREAAGE
ncbi:hypothetical protein ACX93W_01790 [Paenibacillus sp. CAU 1782]